ncbi:hypothetical protein ACH50O_19745 [Methylomonas sp. 2BW1-5-20]|uniref:hypothetical protein n=1 Tax=Methylomonas sp. 2BW1-5-20 TaxID=3376686 RepID=UPI00404EB5F7
MGASRLLYTSNISLRPYNVNPAFNAAFANHPEGLELATAYLDRLPSTTYGDFYEKIHNI